MKKFSILSLLLQLSFVSCSVNEINSLYYDLIGVSVNASHEEIQRYQSRFYLDQIPEPLHQEAIRLNKISEDVHAILADPASRRDYDQNGPKIDFTIVDFFRYHTDMMMMVTLTMNTSQDSPLQKNMEENWRKVFKGIKATLLELTEQASPLEPNSTNILMFWKILNAALLNRHVGWFMEAFLYLQAHPVVALLAHSTHPPVQFKNGSFLAQFHYLQALPSKFHQSYDLDGFRAFLGSIWSKYGPLIPKVVGQSTVIDLVGSLHRDLAKKNFVRDFARYLSISASLMLISQDPLSVFKGLSSCVVGIENSPAAKIIDNVDGGDKGSLPMITENVDFENVQEEANMEITENLEINDSFNAGVASQEQIPITSDDNHKGIKRRVIPVDSNISRKKLRHH